MNGKVAHSIWEVKVQLMATFDRNVTLLWKTISEQQVWTVHHDNQPAAQTLKTHWCEELQHHMFPVYLCMTLDRILSLATHIQKLLRVHSHNSLLKKIYRY